jgi:NADH-quinone oxidoreductase subunit F
VGTERSKGTKTLCLVGKAKNTGLVEVPLGTTIGQIVFDIAGGIAGGKKFKAIQIGGPSGGVIPSEYLNTPVDYESVTALGAIMGSGGVVIMDEDDCMVDIAKFFLGFTHDESCGKCTPCRAGIPELREILTRISEGQGTMKDIDLLTELGEMVAEAALCGLGQTAPNPVLSTIRHFKKEYEAHIIDKKCPAAVCAALFKAPCQHTCPVGLDCFGYAALIKEGKFDEAYKLIKQKLAFPMVLGRVCHHPCEAKCRRAQVDEPVAIRHLKRFAADWALEHNIEYIPEIKEKREEKVAIIGSGPAGLSAAWDLAVYGYQVTVFEALPEAGGMLAVGIPEYRLPKDILKKEVDDIRKLGVEIKLNTRIDDVTSLLKNGYKGVFIAVGAHEGARMGIPGEDLEGVHEATEFLREVNLGKEIKVGKKVAVIGGGNTAVDSARVALRKGAEEVYIFYRREKKDMPAIEEEVQSTEEEGIQLHCLTTPTKILGDNGRVSGLELVRMELGEFDRSGRRTPRAVEGSEYEVDVDMVIEAIGQRPDTSLIKDGGIKIDRGGTIVVDGRTLATEQKGIFAGGDAVSGAATVVEAIAAGQRAASSIKRWLQGKELSPLVERDGYEPIAIPAIPPTEEETQEKARVRISEIEAKERVASFKQVVSGYGPEEAIEEASRCLRCDLEA